MTKIVKKVQEGYFKAVVDGRKRFEVRLADFKSKPGDTLVLLEQQQGTKKLTGRKIECEVLFTLNTKEVERFYSKEEIARFGLVILAVRRKYDFLEKV